MNKSASIIILNYMKANRIIENVNSILRQQIDFPIEIIVADNSVNIDEAEKLKKLEENPEVKVIINEKNTGYTRGNNAAAKLAKNKYLFIVNPDIIWRESNTLQNLVDYLEKHEEIGILAPKQVNDGDGSIAITVRAFPKFFLQVARRTWIGKLPIIKKWVAYDEMRHLDYNKTQAVDWIQSSFWLMKKSLWDALGGLDTHYHLFMSDPDLCFSVWKKGYKVVYYAKTIVYADGIRLSQGGFIAFFQKWTLRQHVIDSLKYCWIHKFKKNPRLKN